jgi:hypothetical protein
MIRHIKVKGPQAMKKAGLPDGIFAYQKSQFANIPEGFEMEIFGLFYGHLQYFTAIWCAYFVVI